MDAHHFSVHCPISAIISNYQQTPVNVIRLRGKFQIAPKTTRGEGNTIMRIGYARRLVESVSNASIKIRTNNESSETEETTPYSPEVPEVTWDDVGGLVEAKKRLKETVVWPIEHPEAYERVSLEPATGVLLYGPPGTGKTLLAKAVANEAESHFISIKGPELFNKYVGETERGIRDVFSTARETAPTVIFFDEIDAIGSERRRESHDSKVTERVVSQLLTELDGLEELGDVVVIAATNRPDMIDYALMRPGRLDRHVQMGAPKETARREIFEIHTRGRPLAADVNLDELATQTNGFVGADIESICREAATNAVREYIMASNQGESVAVEEIELTMDHFEQAIVGIDDRSDDSEQRSAPRAERESVDSTVE